MNDINQFEYNNSDALSGVSTLDAYMSSFSYSRHTHQEYSFGATCKGEQHFSSGGEYHRSLAGNVIVFSPDEAHDGQSGGDGPLVYSMLYISPERMIPLLQAANISASNDYRFDDAIINDPILHHQILSFSALQVEK